MTPSATYAQSNAGRESPLLTPLLIVAALALSYALQLSDGHFRAQALWWLALVLGGTLLAVVGVRWRGWSPTRAIVPALLGGGVLL